MPSAFTPDEVRAIAALANLDLNQSELELFSRQLRDIVGYVESIQEVDTTGIEPTAYVARHPAGDRPDEVIPCLDRADALANAPDAAASGFFKVPRVIG